MRYALIVILLLAGMLVSTGTAEAAPRARAFEPFPVFKMVRLQRYGRRYNRQVHRAHVRLGGGPLVLPGLRFAPQ